MAISIKGTNGESEFPNDAATLPASLYGTLPSPQVYGEAASPEIQIVRDEILDGRTRIVGYRFRPAPASAAANRLDPAAKLGALKTDHLANFAEHRLAVVPISAEEWRTLDYRQFVTPNTVFHVTAPADGEAPAAWIETLKDIRGSGAGVAVDHKAMAGDMAAALPLSSMVFVRIEDYSARGFGRTLGDLHARHLGICVAVDEVGSWDEYRACLELGAQYCLGGFTATPYHGDVAHERAVIDDVLDCKLVQFLWYRAFECGQEDIDRDHRALFALANDLLSGIVADRDFGRLTESVQSLLGKAKEHFLREEAVLTSVGYPRTAQHAAMHRQLTEKAAHLAAEFGAGRIEIGPVFEFLAHDMIVRHMLGADREFFPFLAAARRR